jgi:hypothetical protein
MKRKVLVESTIETDETGKYCESDFINDVVCPHIEFDGCFLLGISLVIEGDKYKRCDKCIKAEVVKPC